jgi:hypothetical protein
MAINSIKNTPVWLVVSLILLNNFWSFTGLELKIYQYAHLVVLAYFVYVILVGRKSVEIPKGTHSLWMILLLLTPLLSVYSGHILLGRHISDSLIVYRMHLGFMLYFVLWYKQVTMKQLMSVFMILGFGYAFLTIAQQVTFPFAPFGMRAGASGYVSDHGGEVERRLGFYRFEIMGVLCAIVLSVMVFTKEIKLPMWQKAILFVSLVASGNRRVIGISGLAIGLCWFLNNKSYKRFLYLAIALVVFWLIYTFRFELFGSLANWSEDLEDGRGHSYEYYLSVALSDPMATWMGWGLPHEGDGSRNIFETYIDGKPVVLADIGLVACFFYWGIFYVISLVGLFLSLALNKNLDGALKSVAIGILAFLWIYFISWEMNGTSFIAMFAYACDLSIANKRKLNLAKLNNK